MTYKVTILLPVYNGENYLESSIQSVLNQSYKDFSLHILDDCSTDSSAEIAQSTGDPRVKYSRNPHKCGLFKTLNRGFSEADSSLVRIWAHDDLMISGSLEEFVQFAELNHEVGMVYCNFLSIDPLGKPTGGEEEFRVQRDLTPIRAGSKISAALFLSFGCLPGNISTVMLRKSAWEKVNGFLEGMQQSPDYDMWLRISGIFDVGYIDRKLIELRDHPLQLSKVGQKQLSTILEELPIYYEMIKRLGASELDINILRFWRHHRGREHIHWMARAILAGKIKTAYQGWRNIRKYQQPWMQLMFWLLSFNGRFFLQKSEREKFFKYLASKYCAS